MFEPGKLSHPLSPVNGEGGGDLPDAQRPDPFTLESLIAWLRTKDADEWYCYIDSSNCLIGQWTGLDLHSWYIDLATFGGAREIAQGYPRTMGGALERAEALLASGRTP